MLRKLFLLNFITVILNFLGSTQIAWATEKAKTSAVYSPPLMYYVQWGVLAVVFLLGASYIARLLRIGKPSERKTGLSTLLVILIFLYFGLGYYHALEVFHEASILSFVRFILMTVAGILVVIYGVLGKPSVYESSSGKK